MSNYTVYLLKSKTTGKHYTGQTEDLERRLKEHNAGLLGKSTKGKGPWDVIYKEEYKTRSEAMEREKYLKTGAGRDYLKKIVENYS